MLFFCTRIVVRAGKCFESHVTFAGKSVFGILYYKENYDYAYAPYENVVSYSVCTFSFAMTPYIRLVHRFLKGHV